ncbi:MAG TPA: hypothetical protein VNL72_04855 [Gammaproteobacteria bacterium]|nr:hypothetical protein [Gammaproteobacteria bacterium]
MTRILNAHPRVLLTNETAVFRQIAEENSLRRWEREMGEAEKSMAVELFGPFLQKYGYL